MKRKRQSITLTTRHSKLNEPSIPASITRFIHTKKKKKSTVESFNSIGLPHHATEY